MSSPPSRCERKASEEQLQRCEEETTAKKMDEREGVTQSLIRDLRDALVDVWVKRWEYLQEAPRIYGREKEV